MQASSKRIVFFFFNDTATTEIYTLSLHDALPIYRSHASEYKSRPRRVGAGADARCADVREMVRAERPVDRKSTRLNSSHSQISYAVFCLKKKEIFFIKVGIHNHIGYSRFIIKTQS